MMMNKHNKTRSLALIAACAMLPLAGCASSDEPDMQDMAKLDTLFAAGDGYIVGSDVSNDRDDAVEVARDARTNPADAQDATDAGDADLDGDDFVTVDEIAAMKSAGFDDEKMLRYLRDANMQYRLDATQRASLSAAGVGPSVLSYLEGDMTRRRPMRDMDRATDADMDMDDDVDVVVVPADPVR